MTEPTDEELFDHAGLGIAIMTAWLHGSEEQQHVDLINQLAREGGPAKVSAMISGLIAVAGDLLLRHEKSTGTPAAEILQGVGTMFARERDNPS